MPELPKPHESSFLVRQSDQKLTTRASLVSRGLQEISQAIRRRGVEQSIDQAMEFFREGHYTAAVSECDAGLKIEPGDTSLLQIKGVNLVRQSKYGQGLRCIDQAIEIDPDNNFCFEIRDRILREIGTIETRDDMKDGIKKIVGKRIRGLAVRRTKEKPGRTHLFLIFSDGTYFELWATDQLPGGLGVCSDLDKGGVEEVRAYVADMESVLETFDESIGT